ncbi:Methionine gamma-lyase [Nymphaea thermarum]|nr:Methionine gamma-lyase [Nymphaea thermarum]
MGRSRGSDRHRGIAQKDKEVAAAVEYSFSASRHPEVHSRVSPTLFLLTRPPLQPVCLCSRREENSATGVRETPGEMAMLEGSEATYYTANGMSAISSVLLQLCASGDNAIAPTCLYGGSHAPLTHFLPRVANITATFVDPHDRQTVTDAIRPKNKVLYLEAMSNSTHSVSDILALSAIAHGRGFTVVHLRADGAVGGEVWADVVVHNISKDISGRADLIARAVCGSALLNSMLDLHQGRSVRQGSGGF